MVPRRRDESAPNLGPPRPAGATCAGGRSGPAGADVTPAAVLAERMARQGLAQPAAGESACVERFRRLQPVSPEANSYPGSPPRLRHRTGGDDAALIDGLRRRRLLVKGRFQDGGVAYVHVDDLPLYAAAYRRPLARLDDRQEAVLRALTREGPLSPRQLRLETGLRHRPLMAAVHRLERAFVVCEDQADDAWDRPLHLVEREHPDLAGRMPPPPAALEEVVERLLAAHVFLTDHQVACGCGLPRREVAAAVAGLARADRLRRVAVAGWGEGWTRPDDAVLPAAAPPRGVWVLHLRDPLVRPHAADLAQRYAGREVLQYLLIDGDLAGAACGHWRIGPHDVEEVVVVDDDLAARRQAEVLAAVRRRYPPPERLVRAYNGRLL